MISQPLSEKSCSQIINLKQLYRARSSMFYKMIIKVAIDSDIPKHYQKEMQTSLRQIVAYVSLELNKNSWSNQGCM